MIRPISLLISAALLTGVSIAKVAAEPLPQSSPSSTSAIETGAMHEMWDKYTRIGQRALKAKDLATAESMFQKAVEQAAAFGKTDPRVVASLEDLAYVRVLRGNQAGAEDAARTALDIKEKMPGTKQESIADSLNFLAQIYLEKGNYLAAAPLLERAVKLKEAGSPGDRQGQATLWADYAQTLASLGRTVEAEAAYKKAVTLMEGQPALELKRAECFSAYADILVKSNRMAEALSCLASVREIREHLLGPHPLVGSTLNNMAEIYRFQGKTREAEPLYVRAVQILDATLGPTDPETCTVARNLGELYASLQRNADAEKMLAKAIAIDHTGDSAERADDLELFAQVLSNQGKYIESISPYKLAFEMRDRLGGDNGLAKSHCLTGLGTAFLKQGQYSQAETTFKQALQCADGKAPEVEMAVLVSKLADSQSAQGNYVGGEPAYTQALAITKQAFGADSPRTAEAEEALGINQYKQSKYADAKSHLESAQAIWSKIDSARSGDAEMNLYLANCYVATGNLAQAGSRYEKALEAADKSGSAQASILPRVLEAYASYLRRTQRPAEARLAEARLVKLRQSQASSLRDAAKVKRNPAMVRKETPRKVVASKR